MPRFRPARNFRVGFPAGFLPPGVLAMGCLGVGLVACAPLGTGSAYPESAAGRPAEVSYGTVIGARPVTAQGGPAGTGQTAATIGGNWRSSLLTGLGGALGTGASAGPATEFVVREDGGRDVATMQTNEDGLSVGNRVAIIRGARTRLARAGGSPAPPVPPPSPP